MKIYVETRERRGGGLQLQVLADSNEELIIHWGVTQITDGSWRPPPHGFSTQPTKSWSSSGSSWETEIAQVDNSIRAVTLDVPLNVNAREGVVFVLRTTSNKWIKNGSEDFFASLDGFTLERPKHQKREHKHKEEKHRKHNEQRKAEPVAPQVQQKPKVKVTAIKRER